MFVIIFPQLLLLCCHGAYINATNTVQSTQLADARIEYRGSGFMDESNVMGWLHRFFVAINCLEPSSERKALS
jgi:hypothetical protein